MDKLKSLRNDFIFAMITVGLFVGMVTIWLVFGY